MSNDRSDPFGRLYQLRDFRNKRSSSWDKSGGNHDWTVIAPGQTETLLQQSGAGCIRHFYWTYIESTIQRRHNIFRGWVLRAYWDGEESPSIEVPLGDLFGVSNGQIRSVKSLAFATNPGSWRKNGPWIDTTWGFNCYLPMPFASGARIEIENQGEVEGDIWYHIDYELHNSPGTADPEATARLHAMWNRENPTEAIKASPGEKEIKNLTGDENYPILEVEGNGQFAGYFLTVVNNYRGWWGEGDDMIFIDGESFPPSIHGTGTEEIFGGGACPAEEYTGPYTGFHCIENKGNYEFWGTNGMYRFYISDPIRFRESIRVTLEHGHGNDMANDYSSVAFWYQVNRQKPLPGLPGLAQRSINFQD